MKLYSTSDRGLTATFAEAVELGIAPDGGLFMPALIPPMPPALLDPRHSFQEIAFEAALLLLGDEIPAAALRTIVETSLTFPVPVRLLADDLAILELFHGPTLAFKDFGARFMARTLSWLRRGSERETTVLVATSGDTGSAVAQGFHGVEGLAVILLYPSGRVSRIQELQLTTAGGTVTALEIDGTFDDCQRLVKQAFADQDLSRRKNLTSANSINIARLLPQAFYYLEAFVRLPHHDGPIVFSVPSGNLGNLTAGLIAWKMGLPVKRFIAATNVNDVLPRYLATGRFAPAPAVPTLSNAMDVGNPSNLVRIIDLFGGDLERMRGILSSVPHTDAETRAAITDLFQSHGYALDPHGAVGYLALRDYRGRQDD
ncbi:MAG TPA: threonine synthase, partial [Bacteroidota bacterium]